MSEVELASTERCEAWLTTRFPRVLVTSARDRHELLDLLHNHAGDPAFDPDAYVQHFIELFGGAIASPRE